MERDEAEAVRASQVEAQIAHFDAVADRYGTERQGANHLLLKRLMWRHFFRHAGVRLGAGSQVLEAMCGFADGKAIIEEHLGCAISYSGFDYSSRVVAAVNDKFPGLD